jgi:prepilin-type N-terminal cleavage/methylation domain-containing protein
VPVSRASASHTGFTLIELLMAMAVFSFMLLIIVAGIMNVLHVRSEALASDKVQDNARVAMNELVRAVRDSSAVVGVPGPGPSGTLCLAKQGGALTEYYVEGGILKRADNCGGPPWINPKEITNTVATVISFEAVVESFGPNIVKPEVKLSLKMSSSNGTTNAAGDCNNNNSDRTFCSSVTLTSGAVPR